MKRWLKKEKVKNQCRVEGGGGSGERMSMGEMAKRKISVKRMSRKELG